MGGSVAGSVLGGVGDLKAGGNASRAAGQDTNALNSVYGADQGAANAIFKAFFAPGGPLSQLMNFQGLKGPELAALQTTQGNETKGMINSLRSQIGGTANPNLTIQGLTGQNMQNQMTTATNLGALASEQELQALLGATGLTESAMGNLLQQGSTFAGLAGAAGQQANQDYSQAYQNFGNAFSLGTNSGNNNTQQNAPAIPTNASLFADPSLQGYLGYLG